LNTINSLNIRELNRAPNYCYAQIRDIAKKIYIPILSELIVHPLLGSAQVLVGVTEMIGGIALAIFGALECIFNQEQGTTMIWLGVSVFAHGGLIGVMTGLAIATPILGTILIRR
jgi:hypothetical protein